jgi:MYXO-CTERM domain-containing protein
VIDCPDPQTHSTPETGCYVAVDFGVVGAQDTCSGATVSVVHDAPPMYTEGETVVTYTAIDPAGHVSTCSTTVTVIDDVPPTIDCQAEVTVEAPPELCLWSGVVEATARDNCVLDVISLGETKQYPVGEHLVDFDTEDPSGNSATCRTALTVLDVFPPTVHCGVWDASIGRVRVSASDACGAVATITGVSCILADGRQADDCPVSVDGETLTFTHGIGAPFSLRWTARGEDPSGNVATALCEHLLDPDTDGDGVPDSVDNCPFDPNPDQSDVNSSGMGDVCDPDPFAGMHTAGGGGCAASPAGPGLPLALLFALGAVALWVRRRRLSDVGA